MKTPRTVLKIDQGQPGSEIAAETAAAMAASSIIFRGQDRVYARRLLNKAKTLFKFAKEHKGTYDGECPFYCSYSGYNLYLEGDKTLETYKKQADNFVCSVLPDSPYHQIYTTPGGLVHLRDGANTQYVTGTAFLLSVYSDIIAQHNQKVTCGNQQFDSVHLLQFAKKQMDYLLGSNPRQSSYMVGFGNNPPQQAHHRGASVPVMPAGTEVSCPMSFTNYFSKNQPNPNELTGAIVGGPDKYDKFVDQRWQSPMEEPCTYVNSLAVGPLAKFATHHM
ncbi:hypothetical protein MKX01_019787 [Papaver californicum]|nr:hypothetical protein MKX01_019787 [Papaver californicum]